VVDRFAVVGADRDGATEFGDGFPGPILRREGESEQVKCFGAWQLLREDLSVQVLGLAESPGAVVLAGGVEKIGGGHFGCGPGCNKRRSQELLKIAPPVKQGGTDHEPPAPQEPSSVSE